MKLAFLLLAALSAAFTAPAGAQSTSGAGRVVVVPLIAQTSTFQSDVTVLNPNGNTITVAVNYYDANNLATAGQQPCANLVIPGNRSVHFSIATQCTLTSPSASHFGMLDPRGRVAGQLLLRLLTRRQLPADRLHDRGLPAAELQQPAVDRSPACARPTAARRSTSRTASRRASTTRSPTRSRCSTGRPGTQVGTPVSGSLQPRQIIRYLDIFAMAGAPPANYSNVRAEFVSTSVRPAEADRLLHAAGERVLLDRLPDRQELWLPGRLHRAVGQHGRGNRRRRRRFSCSPVAPRRSSSRPARRSDCRAPARRPWGSRAAAARRRWTVALCYQDLAGGSVTPFNGVSMSVEFDAVRRSYQAADSVLLTPATYKVGFCVKNSGPLTISNNDWSIGWVDVTPQ
jgi:hypothetical protein